ncbi:MAG: LLM class flavin-dependent oxidoreductase, partial [Chloroflexota bacterium]|nr:LLM class flavin-dependent oxidoreductase [Chloroflexota bacterium]
PWKLARETLSIDHLSDGRLILGVGLGAPEHEEFEWLGEDADSKVRAAKLDEGLDIIAGLWTGEKFGYSGEHYQIKETVFLPRPVQSPRIPIWVAGAWPNKRPFRRAARWDGVFPVMWNEELTPAILREIVGYTLDARADPAPLEVVYSGRTPGADPAQGGEMVASFAEAGATWWVEDLSMWRYIPWEPSKGPYTWPATEIEERIQQGPPKA